MRRVNPFNVQSEDLATVLVRFEGGVRGVFSVGQVCAGHKNDLWFEVNGGKASVRWFQERQNELWVGRRDAGELPCCRGIPHCSMRPRVRMLIFRAAIRRPGQTRFATS